MALANKAQAKALRKSLAKLGKELQKSLKQPPVAHALPDQPFDSLLLRWSPLYARSRALYLEQGGTYTSTLVSSPRTLSSTILLESRIEFTPMQKEYLWAALDPGQRHARGDDHLLTLRTYVASVFHEQSHRILWKLLPPVAPDPESCRRYLNFAESLVIATDIALADELGYRKSFDLYMVGSIYNPGEDGQTIPKLRRNRRLYRNYLQACAYSTYLFLELYTPKQVEKALSVVFPSLTAVSKRTGKLSTEFIVKTNQLWQRRHQAQVIKRLGPGSSRKATPLALSSDPLDGRLQYLWTEKWFDRIGL